MKCHQLSPFEGKVWKSSALLFWVMLALNNAINPALPWKRAWGDNIQSHHQSSQLYQDRAWRSSESSFMEKYNHASLWGAAPWGIFVSLPWEERNSPWAAINWHSRHGVMCLIECSKKINPSCPPSIRWWLCGSKEAGKMLLCCWDTWHSSS